MASENMAQKGQDDSSLETASVRSENQPHDVNSPNTSGMSRDPIRLPASSKTESVTPQKEPSRQAEPDGYIPLTLDVDSQDGDVDSKFGMSFISSTASLRPSLFESVEENGRTYHRYKQGKYYLPNDEVEQERLDLQHHLFLLTLDGKLNLCPIQAPHRVLDIGTGTGIWAMEYATHNPSALVIGSDLSPIQPDYIPKNCHFEIYDAEDEWTYNEKFDFIHGRALFSCFKDPAAVFQKAYDALAPGGYFEMQDIYFKPHSDDGTVEGTAMQTWNTQLIECAQKLGHDWHCTRNYKQWVEDVGFENVVERRFYWPINTWPKGMKNKQLGLWALSNGLSGLSAISNVVLTRGRGMSPEEVEALLVDVRQEMHNKHIHAYYPIYVVYGQKPLKSVFSRQ